MKQFNKRNTLLINDDLGSLFKICRFSDKDDLICIGSLLFMDFDNSQITVRSIKTDKIVTFNMDSTNSSRATTADIVQSLI